MCDEPKDQTKISLECIKLTKLVCLTDAFLKINKGICLTLYGIVSFMHWIDHFLNIKTIWTTIHPILTGPPLPMMQSSVWATFSKVLTKDRWIQINDFVLCSLRSL